MSVSGNDVWRYSPRYQRNGRAHPGRHRLISLVL